MINDIKSEQESHPKYVALIVTLLMLQCIPIVYFGRIYFPNNFHPDTTSFFENYLVFVIGLCFVGLMLSICVHTLWWFGSMLLIDIKLLFKPRK